MLSNCIDAYFQGVVQLRKDSGTIRFSFEPLHLLLSFLSILYGAPDINSQEHRRVQQPQVRHIENFLISPPRRSLRYFGLMTHYI